MMHPAAIVFAKELREGLRDRRSIASALAATLAGPLIVGVVVMMLSREQGSRGPLQVSVAGAEHAPALMQRLREDQTVIAPAPAEPREVGGRKSEGRTSDVDEVPGDSRHPLEGEVRAGRVDVGLVIPDDYSSNVDGVRTAPVHVVSDPTRAASRDAARRLREKLALHARQIATARLIARGINPEVVTPLRVQNVDVSTERARAAVALSVLPVFLLVSAFMMGMGVAVDTTAGERERQSLEPLLLTGAPPMAIGIGKWAATAVLNIAGLVLTLVCAGAILTRLPLEDLGVRLDSLGALSAGVLMAGVPLALVAAALQVTAATYARSFKEGQTYLSMLLFLPMVTGMLVAFSRARPAPWRLFVPVLGQHQLFSAALAGEVPGAFAVALPALIAVATTVVLLRRIASLLSSDRILYGQ